MNHSRVVLTLLGVALTCILSYAILSDSLNLTKSVTNTPDSTSSGDNQPESTITPIPTQDIQLTPNPTMAKTSTTANPTESAATYRIYWSSGFETGDLREWENAVGEFLSQGASPYYQIVTEPVLDGRLAAGLTIDSSTTNNSLAAYLFKYDNPDEGWYSAWYFIPEGTRPLYWWIITQWKSTYNNNSDQSLPMWVLDLSDIPGQTGSLRLALVYRPDSETEKIFHYNDAFTIPTGEWFHISTYYKKSNNGDGAVAVWLNGQEVFNLTGVHTALRDNTLYWSISNYSDELFPYPATLYIDDVIISQDRIPPEFRLP